ncbi:MAG: diaminopimelate epimerase [Planctomycetota bacterium]|nr:MAG: diaminopimelate epimerase [Planctomycetota bacterium]
MQAGATLAGMASIPFARLHGCRNDYVFLDCWDQPIPDDLPTLVPALADRHSGVGGDGVILLLPPSNPAHHATMRMFNADGSESEMCGNGLRALALWARRLGRINHNHFTVATGAGPLSVEVEALPPFNHASVTVDMGPPQLQAQAIPVVAPDQPCPPQVDLGTSDHGLPAFTCIGMGNPHAVTFVPDAEAIDLAGIGPSLEHHPVFPQRCNIEVVSLLPSSDNGQAPRLRQRTWERGSGITMACGTGACAVTVAAICTEFIPSREATVVLDGGELTITWPDDTANVRMRGPANFICDGVFDWPR